MIGRILKIERSPEGEIVIRLRRPKILPEEVRSHLRAARKEGLLAFRSLIDAVITRLEKAEPKEKTKIEVE